MEPGKHSVIEVGIRVAHWILPCSISFVAETLSSVYDAQAPLKLSSRASQLAEDGSGVTKGKPSIRPLEPMLDSDFQTCYCSAGSRNKNMCLCLC